MDAVKLENLSAFCQQRGVAWRRHHPYRCCYALCVSLCCYLFPALRFSRAYDRPPYDTLRLLVLLVQTSPRALVAWVRG